MVWCTQRPIGLENFYTGDCAEAQRMLRQTSECKYITSRMYVVADSMGERELYLDQMFIKHWISTDGRIKWFSRLPEAIALNYLLLGKGNPLNIIIRHITNASADKTKEHFAIR